MQAVFTLKNIVKDLPSYIVHILNSDALERVRTVGIRYGRRSTMDSVVMFLEAVCQAEDLHVLNKVNRSDLINLFECSSVVPYIRTPCKLLAGR